VNDMIGMDTVDARAVLGTLESLSGAIDSIQARLAEIRLASLNPMSYALDPGSLILAPSSIVEALIVATGLTNAKNGMSYLLTLLGQEIEQQDEVSDSLTPQDKGWNATAPTAAEPGQVSLWDEVADGIGTGLAWTNGLLTIEGDFSDSVKAATRFFQHPPAWMKSVTKIGDSSGGKLIPVAGAVLGTVSVFTDWDPNYVWGNTRNIVGAGLSWLEVICLIPPLDPAEIVVAPLDDLWNSMDAVWDLGDSLKWW
jgi:hypothetical protein